MSTTPNNVAVHQYYIHVDGGLYLAESIVTSTVDSSKWVSYYHLWPFKSKKWIRPLEEWTPERFRQIEDDEADSILQNDRKVGRITVTANKAARRAAKASAATS